MAPFPETGKFEGKKIYLNILGMVNFRYLREIPWNQLKMKYSSKESRTDL
jgi:hypothetical protein